MYNCNFLSLFWSVFLGNIDTVNRYLYFKYQNSAVIALCELLQYLVVCTPWLLDLQCRKTLTSDLQVDVILIDTEGVPGHTGVFASVVGLSYVNL